MILQLACLQSETSVVADILRTLPEVELQFVPCKDKNHSIPSLPSGPINLERDVFLNKEERGLATMEAFEIVGKVVFNLKYSLLHIVALLSHSLLGSAHMSYKRLL